jgi:hypothetical protein
LQLPGRTFPGKVTRIADALNPGTRTLLTEVDIPNPDGALKPGTYCRVELHVPRDTPSFLVPAAAIIFNRDGLQVAVIEGGEAHIRKVSVARDLGTQVEVRDGVKEGDVVVLNPQVDLVEGSKVKAQPQTAKASKNRTRHAVGAIAICDHVQIRGRTATCWRKLREVARNCAIAIHAPEKRASAMDLFA